MSKKDTTKNKGKKEKKHFFKDFKAELKKVIWPTPKQLANNVVAVITIVLITGIVVFALDFVFEKANEYGVNKLKSVVQEINKEQETEPKDENSSEEITENKEENSENKEEENSNTENK